MTRSRFTIGLICAAVASLNGTAIAQTQGSEPYPPAQPSPALPAPGKTIPEQTYPCNPGGFEPAEGLNDPAHDVDHDCTGVIDPPGNVDPEIKVAPPAPNAGAIKVIPPDAVKPE